MRTILYFPQVTDRQGFSPDRAATNRVEDSVF
jgi:hypothetical protein